MQRSPPPWLALEISSFQLHETPGIQPVVGVLTNLSPNHLDRYASVDEYYADKVDQLPESLRKAVLNAPEDSIYFYALGRVRRMNTRVLVQRNVSGLSQI